MPFLNKNSIIFLIFLCVLSLSLLGLKSLTSKILLITCFIISGAYTINHTSSVYNKIKDKWYWKKIRIFYHLFVVFVSAVPARWAAATHIGLPAQYLNLTVTLGMALFYIPTWIGLLSLLLLVNITIQYAKMFVSIIAQLPLISKIAEFYNKIICILYKKNDQSIKTKDDPGILLLGNTTLLIITSSFFSITFTIAYSQSWLFKNMAYYADFSFSKLYPCTPKNKKIILLDNGLYAIGQQDSLTDISITIHKIDDQCIKNVK